MAGDSSNGGECARRPADAAAAARCQSSIAIGEDGGEFVFVFSFKRRRTSSSWREIVTNSGLSLHARSLGRCALLRLNRGTGGDLPPSHEISLALLSFLFAGMMSKVRKLAPRFSAGRSVFLPASNCPSFPSPSSGQETRARVTQPPPRLTPNAHTHGRRGRPRHCPFS